MDPKDVVIRAPVAQWPDPARIGARLPVEQRWTKDDIITAQEVEIKELKQQVKMQKNAAFTIAVTACCLIKAIVDGTGVGVSDEGAIEIPREMYERTKGAAIQIANAEDGNIESVYCRIAPNNNEERLGI